MKMKNVNYQRRHPSFHCLLCYVHVPATDFHRNKIIRTINTRAQEEQLLPFILVKKVLMFYYLVQSMYRPTAICKLKTTETCLKKVGV